MNSASSFIASYLINSLWEVPLIAAAGWLISRALKRLGPQSEHLTWVSSLLLALVTPALPMLRTLLLGATGTEKTTHSSYVLFMASVAANSNIGRMPMLYHRVFELLFVAYGVTSLYFLARFAFSLRRTWTVQTNSVPAQLTAEQEEVWREARRSLSLSNVYLQTSPLISGPVTLGIQEPVVLMPDSFLQNCSSQDILAALAHEAAHIKRHDFQKNLLYEILSLPLSFHPALWMIKSQIAQTRELVCDQIATEQVLDRKRYSDSLLRLAAMVFAASRMPASNAVGIFDANILKKRVLVMKTEGRRYSFATTLGFIAPAILLLVTFAVGASAFAVSVNPASLQRAAEIGPSAPIHKIGGDVKAPVLFHTVDPEFPESGRRDLPKKFSKTCTIYMIVDKAGVPQNLQVVSSIRQDFDAKALEAVQQYRFKPATMRGKPVAVALSVEVNFARF